MKANHVLNYWDDGQRVYTDYTCMCCYLHLVSITPWSSFLSCAVYQISGTKEQECNMNFFCLFLKSCRTPGLTTSAVHHPLHHITKEVPYLSTAILAVRTAAFPLPSLPIACP